VSRRGWLLFAVMGVIWGIPYLLIKVAVRDLDPVTLVFLRTLGGSLILLPVALARHEIKPLLVYWKPLLVYTAVEVAIPWLFLSSAETRISSSLAGLLIAAVPLVGAVLAFSTGDRSRLGRVQVAGLLIGFGGVAALAGFDVGSGQAWSIAAIAVVVVGYALGPFVVSHYLAEAPPLGVVSASLAIVTVVYAPIALMRLPRHFPPGEVVASVVVLVVVCTALAFVLFFALIAEAGAVRATVITYVNPAVALLLGVTLLGEAFTAATAVGFVLILVGSFLATRAKRPVEAPDDPLLAPGAAAVQAEAGGAG
jgi:drug/metabolite transporter (DMT)-like permease